MIQILPNPDKTFTISLWIDDVKVKSKENISFSDLNEVLNDYRKYLTPY